MAFVKFQGLAKDPNGHQLNWCRSDLDGMPFRGPAVPLRNDEFDEFTETATDAYAKTFDTSDPVQLKEYREILEGITNAWYQLISPRQYRWVERDGIPVMFVFIEWSVPHKELSAKFRNMIDSPATNLLGMNGNGNGMPGSH